MVSRGYWGLPDYNCTCDPETDHICEGCARGQMWCECADNDPRGHVWLIGGEPAFYAKSRKEAEALDE